MSIEVKNLSKSYNKFKAVEREQVITEEIKYFRPSGMQGFAFNIRKPFFKNSILLRKLDLLCRKTFCLYQNIVFEENLCAGSCQ